MSIPLVMKKSVLLDKLAALRPLAEKKDKESLKVHSKEEQEYLKEFRLRLKEALKWDYGTAKEKGFKCKPTRIHPEYKYEQELPQPRCPDSVTNKLEQTIAQVNGSGMERWHISERGRYDDIFKLLMLAEKKLPADVCEI